MPKTIAIIGGGAAGLMAAVSAQACVKNHDSAKVIILERNLRVGKKLLTTGNGRCNLTNINCDMSAYHSQTSDLAERVLAAFSSQCTIDFFERLGLLCHIMPDGLVYPRSMQAASVLDVLRFEAQRLGVQTICDFEAAAIEKSGDRYVIKPRQGSGIVADRVIVATGSATSGGSDCASRLLIPFGHSAVSAYPALVPLTTDVTLIKAAAGMRVQGNIALAIDGDMRRSEFGEIQFCDYGLSGIAVMQVSGIVSQYLASGGKGRVEIVLDLMPEYESKELLDMLIKRRDLLPHLSLENFLCGVINKRVGMAVIKAAGGTDFGQPAAGLGDGQIKDIAKTLKGWRIMVTGTKNLSFAQVCGGGLRLDEFDCDTLESRFAKGIFVAGEALDVYGDCGGFNLQWAWASGHLAGKHAMTPILD